MIAAAAVQTVVFVLAVLAPVLLIAIPLALARRRQRDTDNSPK